MRNIVCFIIVSYQKIIKPYLVPSCRFHPPCSQYALSAVQKYGVAKGLAKVCLRIVRCSPFTRGGYDPLK